MEKNQQAQEHSPGNADERYDKRSTHFFFNALYRLRLRSNYADAESFLVTLENTSETKEFHKALRRIAWDTLLILEILVARYIGKAQFETWVNEFSERDRLRLGAELIGRRWLTLRDLW